jgi:hypothetical protein
MIDAIVVVLGTEYEHGTACACDSLATIPFVRPLPFVTPFPVAGLHAPMPAFLHPSFSDPVMTGSFHLPMAIHPNVASSLPAPISGSPDIA